VRVLVFCILAIFSCSSENNFHIQEKIAGIDTHESIVDTEDSACLCYDSGWITPPSSPYDDPPLGSGFPKIRVFPERLETGPTDRECEADATVTIRSVGREPLIIDSIEWSGLGAPDVIVSHPSDAVLNQGEQIVIEYKHIENNGVDDAARLFIRSNAINDPYIWIDQDFYANDYPEQIDTHLGEENYRADVLFVIDNSCSMSQEQEDLSASASKFARTLIGSDVDFQIGVITTDSPELRGPIVTPATTDIVGELESQFLVGTGGNPIEKGMDQAIATTSSGGAFSWDAGVLREDSFLTMIFVTDEPGDDIRPVLDYSDWFQGLYGYENLAIFSVINPINPLIPDTGFRDVCTAEYAPRYVELAMLNPGSSIDICGSWRDSLTMIAESSYRPVLEFEMSRTPVEPAFITVTINGIISPLSDWEYDGTAGNRILFDRSNAPTGEDVVQITYQYLECVDGM
jgi:hypothetical protein